MTTTCDICPNVHKKNIDKNMCDSYTPEELLNCQEGFTSYTVEMDKGNHKEIYEYEYKNDDLTFDEASNSYIGKTSIEPIMYVGDQPVIFANASTNEKYYYDPSTASLVSYDDPSKYAEVPSLMNNIDFSNANNVKRKLFNREESTCQKPVEVVDEEESVDNKNVKNALKNNGFSKSFILSLVHELGSKELKVKYIEDDRDKLTDSDFKKLNDLTNDYEPVTIYSDKNQLNNEKISEESEDEEPEMTKPPCPKIEKMNCSGEATIKYDENNCPKLVCNRSIRKVMINTYDIPENTKIVLIIVSLLIIFGSIYFAYNKF
jgi:hypothetical protein